MLNDGQTCNAKQKGPRHQDGVMFERAKGESPVKEATKERRHLYLKLVDVQTPHHRFIGRERLA